MFCSCLLIEFWKWPPFVKKLSLTAFLSEKWPLGSGCGFNLTRTVAMVNCWLNFFYSEEIRGKKSRDCKTPTRIKNGRLISVMRCRVAANVHQLIVPLRWTTTFFLLNQQGCLAILQGVPYQVQVIILFLKTFFSLLLFLLLCSNIDIRMRTRQL